MSNRLLIFKVPVAEASAGDRGARNERGVAIKAACERPGWLEVPVDNTINLLPRIVKLR